MVWNKHFKKWNRQCIFCCIKPIQNYMLLEHLGLNVNPRRLCRNPWGEGTVTLSMSEQSPAQPWLGMLWLRDLLKSGSCHLPLRDSSLQIPAETPPDADTWTDSFSSACPHFHKIHRDGEEAEAQPQLWLFCSLSNKAGPTLESTDFYFARKNLIQKSQHFCLFLQLAQRGGENKWKRLKKSIFDRLRIKNKIRYYGVRMAKVERDLWRWSGPNPTLKHGHSGLWPDNFRISPRMETPQAQRLS